MQAQNWTEIAKALPLPLAQDLDNQYYGYATAIDGNYAVIGTKGYLNEGTAFVLYYNGTNWVTQAQLSASDPAYLHSFGYSVSISGDTIVVGATGDDDNGNESGAVYVFTKPAGGWADMTETAKLTASDATSMHSFGHSVSISGDTIVVGATGDDEIGNNAGAAYVFTKPAGGWNNMTETAKLTASDGYDDDKFGNSVSISGNTVVIGSYKDDDNGTDSGSAYVFSKPVNGWTNMTETAKLTASDIFSGTYFGSSVSISGNTIIVGSLLSDGNVIRTGAAYIFIEPAGGWSNITETAKLTASDGASYDYFGNAVSISGDTVIVGTYKDDDNGTNSGAAYVFSKPVNGWTNMTETAKLTASDGASHDYFGFSVCVSGDTAFVGAIDDDNDNGNEAGATYVFSKPVNGWNTMTETQKTLPPIYYSNNEDNYYGHSVAIDGNYAVVGTYGYEGRKGRAFVLYYNGTNWVTQAQLTASTANYSDDFGYSVSISGNTIVVGAYGDDNNGTNTGAVYVFNKPVNGWTDMTETVRLNASDGSNWFGRFVSISGDNIVVGNDLIDNAKGAAYVFTKPAGGWTNMTETAKLTASDGLGYDYFGNAVSISGETIVVGALGSDSNGSNAGVAYVFTKPANGWTDMTETAKLTASDGGNSDNFGQSVSISGETIVVGAPFADSNVLYSGSAYIFIKPANGWNNMTENAKLTASNGVANDNFGYSVNIFDNTIVVGAKNGEGNVNGSGSAFLFTKPAGGWTDMTETAKLVASDGADDDWFGSSISTSGDYIIVGAYGDDDNGDFTGSAYLFRNCSIAPPNLQDVTGECSVTLTAPTITNICSGTITGTTTAPLTYDVQGNYTVTWNFDDGNGNSTTATQNVIVNDVTPPATPTLTDATDECSVTLTAPTTTDNCAGTITGTTTDPLTYDVQGNYTVTWNFDDGNGNSTTAIQNVIVNDVTPPATPTLTDATDECSVTLTAPTTTDNCAGTITGTTTDPLTYDVQGNYTVTWNFDDSNGNSTTAIQNVIVNDVTSPTVTCPVNQNIDLNQGETYYTVSGTEFDPVSTNDNCTVASVSNDFNNTASLAGAQLPIGTTTVVWTVTDAAGNQTTCNFDVLVNEYVGIEDIKSLGIAIYPNPTNGTLNFDFSDNEVLKISITDITGKRIIEKKPVHQTESIDMSGLKRGVYIIQIKMNDKTMNSKIIKK